MVAKDFTELFAKFVTANRANVEDFSDRFNLLTVVLFLIACVIVSARQYFLNPISCYIPVKPSGDDYKHYLTDYCWVHGTIPLRNDEQMPNTPADWDDYDKFRRITYYQWVPFVLALQCIIFYLPHIVWQVVCSNRAGGDLFTLVKTAAEASIQERGIRKKQVDRVCEFLEDMIDAHQDVHRSHRRQTMQKFGICVVSKRLGTCLVVSYLLVKLLTIANAVIQLWLIQRFLGFHQDGSASNRSMDLGAYSGSQPQYSDGGFLFGLTVLKHIYNGRDWPETLMFPRVSYCYVTGIRLVGVENSYTAQCTLPINMLNEKIYIFFWFWILLLILTTFVSLFLWLSRMINASRRTDFIKRFLRIKHVLNTHRETMKRGDLKDFIDSYLRQDGVFLVRMLALNAGEVITAEIMQVLYQNYLHRGPTMEDKEKLMQSPPEYV